VRLAATDLDCFRRGREASMVVAAEQIVSIFDHPDQVRERFLTADGYRTQYLEAGDSSAPPLVMVHGGACEIGMGTDRWYPNILPLAQTFHVFAVNEIGHGQSDPPRDISKLGHVRYRAEHVLAFIEALGVGPVYLLGQSQGGWIVTYITLKRPDLVRKLVLIDSASTSGAGLAAEGLPYFDNVFEPGTMIPKLNLKTRDGVQRYVSEFCFNKAMINDQMVDRLMPLSERWNDLYMAEIRRFWDNKGLENQAEMYGYNGQHISQSVHQIAVPTLVVWGRESNKGVDKGVELYKRIPHAEMHIFADANHFLWLDRPREFNSLVTWYLTRD
jgi:pimeloyl-ACP methyl ester carboxylesterase